MPGRVTRNATHNQDYSSPANTNSMLKLIHLFPMRKSSARFAALVLGAGVAASPAMILTDLQGRTMDCVPLSSTVDTLSVRLNEDQRIVRIKLAALNPGSRATVEAWRVGEAISKLKLNGIKNRLKSNSQSKSSKSPGGGLFTRETASNSTDRVQSWQWTIRITNPTAVPLKGLNLKYAQVVERVERGKGKSVAQTMHGKLAIPDIGPFGTVSLTTDGVEVRSHKSVNSSNNGSETFYDVNKWDESLSGLGVEIRQGTHCRLKWKTGTDPGPIP